MPLQPRLVTVSAQSFLVLVLMDHACRSSSFFCLGLKLGNPATSNQNLLVPFTHEFFLDSGYDLGAELCINGVSIPCGRVPSPGCCIEQNHIFGWLFVRPVQRTTQFRCKPIAQLTPLKGNSFFQKCVENLRVLTTHSFVVTVLF